MVRLCCLCNTERAVLRRPKTFQQVCRNCFYDAFELEIHETITSCNMFRKGERVAIAASGGKDSTVLAHLLTTLNQRYSYELDLFLLSVDEGIAGYRDDSLETVKRNEAYYGVPLKVVSYSDLYGWTMDQIVAQVGTRNNCTFCGVFRRQALDRGATLMKADKVATGHNADDMAETILLNMLRGDVARLGRCTSIITGEDGVLPRVKPFKYAYEKEIVMYAYFKKLDYFSTECVYAPFAARGFARDFVKDLEAARPSAIIDLIRSAEQFRFQHLASQRLPQPRTCDECGFISSQPVCKACTLLQDLNKGRPRRAGAGVTDSTRVAGAVQIPAGGSGSIGDGQGAGCSKESCQCIGDGKGESSGGTGSMEGSDAVAAAGAELGASGGEVGAQRQGQGHPSMPSSTADAQDVPMKGLAREGAKFSGITIAYE